MSDTPTETILIIGGAFAGISAAHYALRHVLPKLPAKQNTKFTVTMVNPSEDFFWRIAAPRAIVSEELMPASKLFYPIEPAFAYAGNDFKFIQGTATAVDEKARHIKVMTPSMQEITIPYVALIIASGMRTPSPLFTMNASTENLKAEHESFRKSIKAAKHIVIGGAGPVGVETAGELGEFLNGKPGFFSAAEPKPEDLKCRITLVCAERKMLPVLRESIAKTAEKYLKRLGCDVINNASVRSALPPSEVSDVPADIADNPSNSPSRRIVSLSDGKMLDADLYIDCTGSVPNTGFLPPAWLDTRGKLSTHPKTLRVNNAPPRVYGLGDVASYTRGGVIDQQEAVPVCLTNLRTDLIAYITGKAPGPDRHHTPSTKENQICPIGTQKGVGAFNGFKLPSQMVWAIKGRDYLVGMLAKQQVSGEGFKVEKTGWKGQPVGAAENGVQKVEIGVGRKGLSSA